MPGMDVSGPINHFYQQALESEETQGFAPGFLLRKMPHVAFSSRNPQTPSLAVAVCCPSRPGPDRRCNLLAHPLKGISEHNSSRTQERQRVARLKTRRYLM